MTVRNLAGAGLVLFAIGGPLLVIGLVGGDLPITALAGIVTAWLGLLLVLAALLQLGRTEHRMLQAQGRSLTTLATEVASLRAAAEADALDERFATSMTELQTAVEAQRSDLLRVLDARVLGIHETVRDIARGEHT